MSDGDDWTPQDVEQDDNLTTFKEGLSDAGFNVEDLPGFRGHVVPWPGHIDTVELSSQCEPLTREQDARATALYHARSALERRGGALTAPSSSTPPSVDQIIRLANWIISGKDPL